ncbi:hypothetical protein KBD69_04365 [Candidatus Woesebacteria bacterium]|nr:hypothetical protein [Candidatus Woesebacteria bacterium]
MKIPWKLIATSTACLGVLATLLMYRPHTHDTEHVHYHAGFKVYIDDQLQDYSGYQHMNYTPCSLHDEKKSPAEEQMEKAHLHENVGDVVHVHREGAVWGDLFENIKANLPQDKIVRGFVDGSVVEDIMKTPIKPYTTAIILVGESDASRSAEVVSREHIEEVEKKSELCGT